MTRCVKSSFRAVWLHVNTRSTATRGERGDWDNERLCIMTPVGADAALRWPCGFLALPFALKTRLDGEDASPSPKAIESGFCSLAECLTSRGFLLFYSVGCSVVRRLCRRGVRRKRRLFGLLSRVCSACFECVASFLRCHTFVMALRGEIDWNAERCTKTKRRPKCLCRRSS